MGASYFASIDEGAIRKYAADIYAYLEIYMKGDVLVYDDYLKNFEVFVNVIKKEWN